MYAKRSKCMSLNRRKLSSKRNPTLPDVGTLLLSININGGALKCYWAVSREAGPRPAVISFQDYYPRTYRYPFRNVDVVSGSCCMDVWQICCGEMLALACCCRTRRTSSARAIVANCWSCCATTTTSSSATASDPTSSAATRRRCCCRKHSGALKRRGQLRHRPLAWADGLPPLGPIPYQRLPLYYSCTHRSISIQLSFVHAESISVHFVLYI